MMDSNLLIKSVIKFMAIFGSLFVVTMASFMNGGVLIAWTSLLFVIIAISAAGIVSSAKRINILPALTPLFLAFFLIYESVFGRDPGFPLDIIILAIFIVCLSTYLILVQRGMEFR